jgi:hypothetical protein
VKHRLLVGTAVAVTATVPAACASSAPSAAAPAATAVPACAGTAIGAWIAIGHGTGVSGTTDYPLEFTNLGRSACSLSGYPVVSAISSAGVQLGSPAGRGRQLAAPRVVLAPGATAHTTLAYQARLASSADGCRTVGTAAELRVYLAGQKNAAYAAFGLPACSDAGPVYLTITEAIRAGAGAD